jgi:hypothetical protein
MRKLAALCVASFCGVGAWACSAAGSEAFGIVAQGIVASLGASAVGAAQQADVLSSSQLAPPSLDDVRDRSAPWDEIDRYLKPPGRSAAAPASETEPAPFTPPGQHQRLAQQSEETGRDTAAQAPAEAEEDALSDPWLLGAAAMATTGMLGVLGLLWQKRRRLQRRLQAAAQLASAWSQAKSVADSQHSVGQTVRRAA